MKREYPESPIVTVALVVRRGDRALIIRRGNEPNKGRWSIPGGAVEVGERLRDAGRREVQEECGIEVEVGELAGVFENIVRDAEGRVRFHYIMVDFFAEYVSGELTPGSDVLDARWVTLAGLDQFDVTEQARELLTSVLMKPGLPS